MRNFYYKASGQYFTVQMMEAGFAGKDFKTHIALKGKAFQFLQLSTAFLIIFFCMSPVYGQDPVSFGTLVEEMTDLERLTTLPEKSYRMIQYSSYDRRSQIPGMQGWFYNSDGFGSEPVPGFEEVLSPPAQDGSDMGTYLICDVEGPGAILRLWTASINGRIKLFLDNMEEPVYEGEAEDFFWNTAAAVSGMDDELTNPQLYRQFDATYFPIPFSQRCRIEWTGDIKKIHFYHVGIRLYEEDVEVSTFRPDDIGKYAREVRVLKKKFGGEETGKLHSEDEPDNLKINIPPGEKMDLVKQEGPKAVDFLSIKASAANLESTLRSCILSIYFDEADIPQVHAPLGDFFGAAPGLNPYASYPYAVLPDGSMICKFIMPFKESMRIEIENLSDEPVDISGGVHVKAFTWEEGRSMHFFSRWKMDHGLTASNSSIIDIPYLLAQGRGRIVGAAAFIYNPSEAVASWGNWWGEGDEKIFIDGEAFPSFFGTGSEDYFNYSWSAERFFAYPYCGQPRNDGPGNRGYVTNFRWHILDDLYFKSGIAFYMELYHHGVVPDFSYGRMVHYYALPGIRDDFMPITRDLVAAIPYNIWEPIAYLGSRGFTFHQAEKILDKSSDARVSEGRWWSQGKMVLWQPESQGDDLTFLIPGKAEGEYIIGLTLAHMPEGGAFSVILNGASVRFSNQDTINLKDSSRTYLKNYFSESVRLKQGENEMVLRNMGSTHGNKIGIDFFWVKED